MSDIDLISRLSQQAGSWFDRHDLPLAEREAAVAKLIADALQAKDDYAKGLIVAHLKFRLEIEEQIAQLTTRVKELEKELAHEQGQFGALAMEAADKGTRIAQLEAQHLLIQSVRATEFAKYMDWDKERVQLTARVNSAETTVITNALVRSEHERQIDKYRAALERIDALEPGSKGAYSKFAECQRIASEALAP